ncbi:MAG: hypothetical protein V8R64_13980 [Thomasclavelia sp.]
MEHLKNSLFIPFVTGTICIASMVLMDLCRKVMYTRNCKLKSASIIKLKTDNPRMTATLSN